MGLQNVAVHWPRTGRWYDRVEPAEFTSFAALAERMAPGTGAAAALAADIASLATVPAGEYADLVDLLLGLTGVLNAADSAGEDSAGEDEDPVIDPDGCAWIAGGLERFVDRHLELGKTVTVESVSTVLRNALCDAPLADQQLIWLEQRLAALTQPHGVAPSWHYSLAELGVLARFYRLCADRGFAVYVSR